MQKTSIAVFTSHRRLLNATLAFMAVGCVCAGLANAQVTTQGGVTVLSVTAPGTVDFSSARVMPLPTNPGASNPTQSLIQALLSGSSLGTPGVSAGAAGDGATSSASVPLPASVASESDGVLSPEDFGTNNHPFSTERADLNTLATNTQYSYSPAGKLFFNISGAGYICSASLIKRGVIVTAAHCVANYGKKQFYSGWTFVPGYRNGAAPFGSWTGATAYVLTAYYAGTDGCATYGVVCPDDVAVIVLNHQGSASSPVYPGTNTGWFGYGWNGYGYVTGITQITQLGYPAGLNSAQYMERNDSYGYVSSSNSNNTVIGSDMNGGSVAVPGL